MLTIATMTPAKAGSYYKENYYEEEDQVESSEWWGEGADELGLSGHINDGQVFRNVLNGLTPDGTKKLRSNPPKGKEARAGTDLTFSAPKSVSIAALVGGDQRLIDAHNKVVNRMLVLIQQRYAETRVKKQHQKVNNLTVAKFLHDTSRELDPDLHTHCLVMNLAQDDEGTWRSAANRLLYRYRILLGRIYQNELAYEVEQLGYGIELREDGLFELKGYSREQIESFSKRHQQILGYLEAEGLEDTTENRIQALFATRKTKQKTVDRRELHQLWESEAKEFGIVHPKPDLSTSQKLTINMAQWVDQSIQHSEERTAIFSNEDLEDFIFCQPTGQTFADIEATIQANPRLITSEKDGTARYATQESLIREKLTIAMMQDGQGKLPPILHPKQKEKVELPDNLTPSQMTAVRHALDSQDRILGWVGVAGAGKTFTLKTMVAIAILW